MQEIVLASLAAPGLLLLLLLYIAQRRLLAKAAAPEPAVLPAVSVLKPLKGADPGLEENLASFFRLDYPEYEVVLGAEDPADPALEVARRVAAAHPGVRATVAAGGPAVGLNPKVNNLARLARRARHPVLLVSDSNTAAPPALLRAMAAALERPGVGLVSAPIRATGAAGPGGALESLQIHTFVAGGVAALAEVFGGVCVVGKAMLLRRTDLEAMGGFPFLGQFLAEDQVCGEEMARRGRAVVLGAVPVQNRLGRLGVRAFVSRHLRWARIRRRVSPAGYAGEILLDPVFLAAGGALVLRTPIAAAVFGGTLLLKAALDAAAERTLGVRRPLLHYPPLVLARDLLVGVLWPVPFFSSTVLWRGRRYRLGPRTRVLPETASPPLPAPAAVPGAGTPEPVGA